MSVYHEMWKKEGFPTAKDLLKKHQLPLAVELLHENYNFPKTANALLKKYSLLTGVGQLGDRPPQQSAVELLKSQRPPQQSAVELLKSQRPLQQSAVELLKSQRPPQQSAVELLKSQHLCNAKELCKYGFQTADELLMKTQYFHTLEWLLKMYPDKGAKRLLQKHHFSTVNKLLENQTLDCFVAKTVLQKPKIERCPCTHPLDSHYSEPIYNTIYPRKYQKENSQLRQADNSKFWSNIMCTTCLPCWTRRRHPVHLGRTYDINIDEEEENIYVDINKMFETGLS
ncbi:uncharacterized protein LOC117333681 [Pecten maximus]|uniref:uncharacterized protein LOC117333681 n=1 Tax=Pecten maximus TaxID=6579 RepID=UPI0014590D71|nr:uncharacterized protein LOC117333681 [Pecten maximus]